jgi:hypothetical protein
VFPFVLSCRILGTRGRDRFDRGQFFGEQAKEPTIGIERLKATAAAKDKAHAAVGAG